MKVFLLLKFYRTTMILKGKKLPFEEMNPGLKYFNLIG